ncbi:phosphatases II, partial [Fomitiporia mediterranea MF3/22]|uniref:phosphatases II n=1 Tax=Fomitiporia mediterranea (strain MF3/22) TaxID=694068 RepID=UPI00044077FC
LLQNHITHVLSIGKDSEDDLSPEINVKKMELEDEADAKIADIFDEACQFISEGNKGNNMILIHCNAGESRSLAVVIHYLHYHKDFPMSRAFFFVAIRRPVIAINPAFKKFII